MTAQPSPPPDAVRLHSVRRRLNIATVVITFGALAFGYDTGVISGALPFMTRSTAEGGLGLTPTTSGMVTSSLLFGAAFGAIIGGRLSDRHGRRRNVMMLALVFFLGALGCALAPNLPIMLACRMILGFAVGGASATVPMFIGELAPAERRGPLVSRNEFMIVTGQLIAYVSNAIIGLVSEGGHAWRLMLGLAAIPAAALWIGVHFVPESPRWLVSRGRGAEALEVLALLRTGDPRPEVEEIAEIVKKTAEAQSNAREHLGTPWIRRITLIGIGFGIVIQLTGVNAIMYFAPTVLMSTGMGTQASLVATIANGVVSVIAVAVGLDIVVFIIPSELYPLRIRATAMSLTTGVNWTLSFIVSLTFLSLFDVLGGAGTFGIYAVATALLAVFAIKVIPETRGKTLEDIEREYVRRDA